MAVKPVRLSARKLLDGFLAWRLERARGQRHAPPDSLRSAAYLARPTTPTEFDVQATLWCGLRGLGYECHGHVPVRYAFAHQAGVCDLAVYRRDELLAIIEVKKDRRWQIPCTAAELSVHDQACQYAMACRTYVVCGEPEAKQFLAVVKSCDRMPSVLDLRWHGCAVDHVVVMSEYRFEWNGVEMFRRQNAEYVNG